MKYSDMMQKCEYIHFEAWILNGEITKQLAPIDKQAILQQVLVRDKEIMELQDKLQRRNKLIAYIREEHKKCGEEIKELKKKRIEAAYIEKLLHQWQATKIISFDCNVGRRNLALYLAEIINR